MTSPFPETVVVLADHLGEIPHLFPMAYHHSSFLFFSFSFIGRRLSGVRCGRGRDADLFAMLFGEVDTRPTLSNERGRCSGAFVIGLVEWTAAPSKMGLVIVL